MADEWDDGLRSLIEAPSPAVLTTYRKDGSANVSPVWFRWHDHAFKVVIAHGSTQEDDDAVAMELHHRVALS